MQHASSKSARRNKQVATEHITNCQKSGNVDAIGRGLLSVNQTDVNRISPRVKVDVHQVQCGVFSFFFSKMTTRYIINK